MQQIGMHGPLLPSMFVVIELPTRPEDIARRYHNKIVREAMKSTAEKHHEEHIPEHFKSTNRQKYKHAPRSEKYKAYKRKRWHRVTDLVLTGRTKDWMERAYKLRVGGNAEAGTTTAKLILTFPFKGGTGRFKDPQTKRAATAQKTIQQMIGEMETITDSERRKLGEWFLEEYMKGVDNYRAGRKRIRKPIT